jgi:hypothetical protein
VALSATDNDGGSGVDRTEYVLDGSAGTIVYTAPFAVSGEGESSLRFRSIDNVGNVETVQDATVKIDKTAPTGSISLNNGDAFTGSGSITLSLNGDDGMGSGVSKMRLAATDAGLVSAPWEDYAASRPYSLPSDDGTKTVYVQFRDAVGHVSSTYSDSIVLDASKPTISAAVVGGKAGANGWYTSSVTVRFTCSDGGSGIPVGACPNDQILSAEGPSVSSAAQTVTDGAGIASDPSNIVTAKIDKTAPTVAITDPTPEQAVQDIFGFTADVSDSVSGPDALSFSVRSDDGSADGKPIGFEKLAATKVGASGSAATFRLGFDTTKLPDGYYLLLAQGFDGAGNVTSSSATFHVKVVNLALVKMLPATDSNKAGRTMPVKFSLRESSTRTFIENQQLTINIRQKGSSSILQSSTYGTGATNYRIDSSAGLYIANFQTSKTLTAYVVEAWRQTATTPLLIGTFDFQTVK